MNYYRDLIPENKVSGPKLIIPVIYLLYGLIRFVLVCNSDEKYGLYEWLLIGMGLTIIILWIMDELGYHPFRVPENAYVRINDDVIAFKPYVNSKEKVVRWKDVNDILYSAEKYTMRMRDGGTVVFELTTLDYAVIQEAKAGIDELATEKKINIITRTLKWHTESTDKHGGQP